jgi:C4-dicarboxylate-specific signal transduction histidine kinase
MESLGRLTGGIAHDFNNLLTVVLGNLEIIEMRSRGTGLERSLQAIRRAADRGAQLTRELLAFARSGNAQPSLVDLNERVRGFLGMLRQSLPPEVAIDLDLQENLPAVSVDPVHLDLALLNLVMPGALDGIGLAREAQRSHPSLKILLISGYNDSAAEARSLGLTILRKPFELGALADAIRAAGGEARAQAG